MRARSIKPGICDNEVLGTADPFYTLLFERLWMIADREGRLEDRPLRIKAQAFPYRDGLDVEPMLAWLANEGFIVRYEIEGKRYIQVLEFKKHQKPHANEQDSVIPPPKKEQGTNKEVPEHNQGSAMDALNPSSLNPDSGPPDSDTPAKAASVVENARAQMSQAGEMAAALRQRDVTVTSMNPTLIGWIQSGFTVSQVCEAVEVARKTKETGSIPANYLDKILRQPARPPPASAASRLTWRPPDDDGPDACTTPNSTPSAKH
jgi:hypothetical protein